MKNICFYLLFIAFLIHQSSAQKANLVIPIGHAQKINHIEVNYDFSHLASVDNSNIIHIWDAKSKREIYQLKDHNAGIVNIDFHPSKKEMVSGDQDGQVFLWNYASSEILIKIDTKQKNAFVRYNWDGTKLITGGGNLVQIWNTTDGSLLGSKELESRINFINVSKKTKQMAIGTENGALVILDEKLMQAYLYSEETVPISVVRYYDTENKVMIGYKNGVIKLIQISKQTVNRNKVVFEKSVGNIIINPASNSLVACGLDGQSYVKFLGQNLEDQTPGKFKWSSTPKDNLGLFGIAWADSSKQEVYIVDHDNVIRKWNIPNSSWDEEQYRGTAFPIMDIDLDSAKQKLAVAAKISNVKIFDLTGVEHPILLGGHDGGIIRMDFHPKVSLLVASGEDGEIKFWNTDQQEVKQLIKKATFLDFNMQFTTDRFIIRKVDINSFELFNFKTGEKKVEMIPDVLDLKVSNDGTLVAFKSSEKLIVYASETMSLLYSIPLRSIKDFDFNGEQLFILGNDGNVSVYSKEVLSKSIKLTNTGLDKIVSFTNKDFILYSSSRTDSKDYKLYYYDISGNLKQQISGHTNYVTKILDHRDRIITSSLDGTIKFWKKEKLIFEELGTFIPLWKDNYVVTTPNQLFDASPDAMDKMHYTRGSDIIAFDQLKDIYYEPNLLSKLMGYSSGSIRKPSDISTLGIYPELQITHPNLNNGKLGIKITDKGGGIGRVVLNINGKEVASDVREIKDGSQKSMGIEYDIQGHPYMHEDKVNKITIKAYNIDGTLGSEPHSILVLPSGKKNEAVKSKIFALIIGSSNYASDGLDLKYAAKDAQDFAAALRISSTNLIGGDNIDINVLTTDKEPNQWPTKENIKKVFEKFSNEANARDYLIVYMAGHGVNSGGQTGDFYYLTCEADNDDISKERTRVNHAISSAEFTEYIKKVPALKQVMIVDACHSGSLTSSFGKTMDSDEVKALERMKDRTGLFLLVGSAADAVSYETTLYGQGLLTYALLFGIKGAALRDGEYIDVLELFQFAATKVPQLAQDIGGVQRPEVRIPSQVSSFDIGKMSEDNKSKITLLSPKPVFIQTNFQDINEYQDALGIGSNLDSKLMALGKTPNSPLVFMNENKFGGAYQVRGRYEQKGGLIVIDVKVFQDNVKTSEFKTQGTNANDISDKILNRLLVDYK